jgi:tRNA threonylcarbamoyladenosine biosynthesis protein TsaB
MKLLALDCSTARASVALLENGELIHEQTWETAGARHENVVAHIARLMERGGWRFDEVERMAVGRGPGAYAGLRASLLAAQALAAPSRTPVMAVSSMDALALRLMREHEADGITLIGDARRNSVWLGRCVRDELETIPTTWRLVPVDEAVNELAGDGLIATPHWPALETIRRELAEANWIKESQHPTAMDVAALVLLRHEHHAATESRAPLYLHAPV